MAHGFKEIKQGVTSPNVKNCSERKHQVKTGREGKSIGSRRMFSTQFKLQVLDSYRQDADCRGNQRATARKYGIHRRQIQKWLQMEMSLRCSASESGEVALNLVGQSRLRDDTYVAGCLPQSQPSQDISEPSQGSQPTTEEEEEEELNVDGISDSDDDGSSGESILEQDQALDFTCAALSRRRSYSLSFKLEVLDAFYNDTTCCGNQRATALKFGVHRRQIQKWLSQEGILRGEHAWNVSSPTYVERSLYHLEEHDRVTPVLLLPTPLERSDFSSPGLDLSRKRKFEETSDYSPEPKKVYFDLEVEKPSSAQETALCLVKPTAPSPPEVSSSLDVYRVPYSDGISSSVTYWPCCSDQPPTTLLYDCWPSYSCPYTCITSRLHHDAYYYKQAVNDINLHRTPLFS